MSEQDLWEYTDQSIGDLGHFSRVESHLMSAGIPDVDFCIEGTEGHIELKYGFNKVPKIRGSQARWFRNRVRAGGKPWMFTLLEYTNHSPRYLLHEAEGVVYLAAANWARAIWIGTAVKRWDTYVEWSEFLDTILRRE